MSSYQQQTVGVGVNREFSRTLPFLVLMVAILFMASSTIFIKISELDISANSTHFNRLWIATGIFGVWSGIRQFRKSSLDDNEILSELPASHTTRDIMILVVVALSHTLARFFWTWCLTQTSAANGNVLCNLAALFTVLGGWLFLGKKFNLRFLIGLGFAIVGATTLSLQDLNHSTDNFLGDLAALLSAMCFAITFLSTEQIRSKFSVITLLTWRCLIGLLIMLPVTLVFEEQVFPISRVGWLAVIGLATLSEVIGHGLVIYSLKHFSSAFVTLCILLEPVIVAVMAWIVFSETLSPLNFLSFCLVLAGVYMAQTDKGSEANDISNSTVDG